MSDPKRFAGYKSPGRLASDPSLTREQKIGALQAWGSALKRRGMLNRSEATANARLFGEIEQAIIRLRTGQS
jgi:hypothetical protein